MAKLKLGPIADDKPVFTYAERPAEPKTPPFGKRGSGSSKRVPETVP